VKLIILPLKLGIRCQQGLEENSLAVTKKSPSLGYAGLLKMQVMVNLELLFI
jgi:hypothetical protein